MKKSVTQNAIAILGVFAIGASSALASPSGQATSLKKIYKKEAKSLQVKGAPKQKKKTQVEAAKQKADFKAGKAPKKLVNASSLHGLFTITPGDSSTDHPLIKNETPNTPVLMLYKGILAAPGSPERIKAAEVLEWMLGNFYKEFKFSEDQAVLDQQLLMKNIYQMTIEYMKSGNRCAPEKRVRLYRGIGTQPLVRVPGSNSGGFQIFMDPMVNIMAGLIVGGKMSQNTNASTVPSFDAGELAHYYLDDIALNLTRPFDWVKLLDKRKTFIDGAGSEEDEDQEFNDDGVDVNGRYDYIAAAHTDKSEDSPLISTTISRKSVGGYGPATMVLDVCPERILPANQKTNNGPYMGEEEFYLPLITFPEENIRIAGVDCGRPNLDGKIGGKGCGYMGDGDDEDFEESEFEDEGEYVMQDDDPIMPMTAKMRLMFNVTGHPYENSFRELDYYGRQNPKAKDAPKFNFNELKKTRYFGLQDQYYNLMMTKAASVDAWREAIDEFKPVADCAIAQEIVTRSEWAAEVLNMKKPPGEEEELDEESFKYNVELYQRYKPELVDFIDVMTKSCGEGSIKLSAPLP